MTSPITISTFNVLHDLNKWVSPILQPSKRYDYIIKSVNNCQSDIYCFNQITSSFWPKLSLKLTNKFPYFTQPLIKQRQISVAIFSKWPIKTLYQSQSLIIAYINGFIIVATHLVALEQKYQKRQYQITKIVQKLKETRNISLQKQIRQAFQKKNIIILGDLNLHLINETHMIYKYDFYDAWIELQKDQLGYTWDPKQNSVIGWFLPFDNRRMRLDRILVKQNSRIKPSRISIDFNQKVPNTFFLFPSDHFGLTMTFTLQNQPHQVNHQVQLSKIPNKRITGFRPMKTIKRYVKISMIFLIIGLVLFLRFIYRLF